MARNTFANCWVDRFQEQLEKKKIAVDIMEKAVMDKR